MSCKVKGLIIILTLVVVVAGILPQMAQAHKQEETILRQKELLAVADPVDQVNDVEEKKDFTSIR